MSLRCRLLSVLHWASMSHKLGITGHRSEDSSRDTQQMPHCLLQDHDIYHTPFSFMACMAHTYLTSANSVLQREHHGATQDAVFHKPKHGGSPGRASCGKAQTRWGCWRPQPASGWTSGGRPGRPQPRCARCWGQPPLCMPCAASRPLPPPCTCKQSGRARIACTCSICLAAPYRPGSGKQPTLQTNLSVWPSAADDN